MLAKNKILDEWLDAWKTKLKGLTKYFSRPPIIVSVFCQIYFNNITYW